MKKHDLNTEPTNIVIAPLIGFVVGAILALLSKVW